MDFNTLLFPAFFALCAALVWLCPGVVRPYLLLAASYLFYCYQPDNRRLVVLLLFATAVTWFAGVVMDTQNKLVKKLVLAFSILACLAPLVLFKYFSFFHNLAFGTAPARIIAPLGLSYFTFQSLSYLIDRYRGKYPIEPNPLKYALFVSFFPCIFTGPIERYDHLMPQLCKRPRFDYDMIAGGAFRMLWGYAKKMILANRLSEFVIAYYCSTVQVNGPTTLAAAALFSLQLYMDFSGACDMAIGGARMMGIELMENFDSPFLATSYADLWRRWHKSLTGWFREYLYFSLGGNRKGLPRWAINSVLVFVVSGVWHGSSMGYFWWGLVTGLIMVIEQLPARIKKARAAKVPAAVGAAADAPAPQGRRARRLQAETAKPAFAKRAGTFVLNWLRRVWVFTVFSLSFMLFSGSLYNAKDLLAPYAALFTGWDAAGTAALSKGLETYNLTGTPGWVVAFGVLLVIAAESRGNVAVWIRRRFILWRWALYILLAAGMLFFAVYGKSAFIYQLY